MSKQTEALKLALEALEYISSHYMSLPKIGCMALAAVEEALAEQEIVLPGGGHVPAVPVAVYGYCPECGGAGVMRERRPNGDDKCTNGHKYPSSKALAEQPAQQQEPVAWADLNALTEQFNSVNCGTAYRLPGENRQPLYTSPPASKPWVGLTDEDFNTNMFSITSLGVCDIASMKSIAKDVEAKLREKNT